MASEHHHLQLEKPPYPKVERPQVGRIKQRAERSNHKINLCAIRTSIGRDLVGPHLSIIQGGPELEVLFLESKNWKTRTLIVQMMTKTTMKWKKLR